VGNNGIPAADVHCMGFALERLGLAADISLRATGPGSHHQTSSPCAGAMWASMNFLDADERCVGFTAPRVGNKAFCKLANCKIRCGISLRRTRWQSFQGECAGAMWVTVNFPDADVRCVGFAAPRVGNKAFCQSANYLLGSAIRVEYGHDPIPNMPGRGLYASPSHAQSMTMSRLGN